ncbi:MAG: 4Fe-4S binding protein, partial [Slackia sp.]|nr:4Fe-4S binding protein [Slackia sp.]
CPAGTVAGVALVAASPDLQSIVGALFTWKVAVLAAIVFGAMTVYRPFCRFLCPLGALYGFFNRFCALRYVVNPQACTGCGACMDACRMDVARVSDHECIQCGECKKACVHGAIRFSVSAPSRKSFSPAPPTKEGRVEAIGEESGDAARIGGR